MRLCFIFLILLAFVSGSAQPDSSLRRNSRISGTLSATFNHSEQVLKEKAGFDERYQSTFKSFSETHQLLQNCLKSLRSDQYYGANSQHTLNKYYGELENYGMLISDSVLFNDPDSLENLIRFIREDLELKYDNSSVISSALVRLRVRVLNAAGNRELPGYQVYVKPEISVDSRLIEMFNPTTNAVKLIAPGKKLIWIEKDGKRFGERKEGIRRSAGRLTVDFIIPK